MKRKKDLYENIYNLNNISAAFDEVCNNTRNKRKVANYQEYKCVYITRIYEILKNREYVPGPFFKFMIHDPKERMIASQGMQDKVINHLVARHILYPAILPCLLDVNIASRKELGTQAGLNLERKFTAACKAKYKEYYVLKCDVSKFFASINQERLKEKIFRRINDPEALKIVFDIIESEPTGLNIGSMTSQVLAIFYLNDMDHFIKETLKIKYYIRYQDDFLLFHPSKKYLQYCLEQIQIFLEKEKLKLNNKTRIYKSTNNFIFLGHNKKGKYVRYRPVSRKLKKRRYLYQTGQINLQSLTSSIINYEHLCKKHIKF